MTTIKKYTFLLFLAMCSCSKHASIQQNLVHSNSSDTLSLSAYLQKNPCSKIVYLNNLKEYNLKFYEAAIVDMYKMTGISPSISAGYVGVYYESDSIRKTDLKKWGSFLSCDSILNQSNDFFHNSGK